MAAFKKHDYGPLRSYEIVWRTGHIETVQGHQITHHGGAYDMFSANAGRGPVRVMIHGMFPGDCWRLVLSALEDDIVTIRDVTDAEHLSPEDGAS